MTVRVLVVDDEPDVETLFRQQFRREVRQGLYTLDFALSGKAALEMLADHVGEEIILLVSDINMPGMTGLELLPAVKQKRPDLPVFMISAYGDARYGRAGDATRGEQVPGKAGGFFPVEAGRKGGDGGDRGQLNLPPTKWEGLGEGGACGTQNPPLALPQAGGGSHPSGIFIGRNTA